MSTLLLRLAAPMQSWGVDSKFDRRGTERAPSKSGVIGMVAAAMGRRRDDPIDDLAKLKFGVRTDKPGTLLRDYHTAKSEKSAYVTNRYYIADAVFLAGLEGDEALLAEIEEAIRHPAFPLFLGRRSCPPEGRVSIGICNLDLQTALESHDSLLNADLPSNYNFAQNRTTVTRRIVIEVEPSEAGAYMMRDMPVSFSKTHRKFAFRFMREYSNEHGPLGELEESA